MDMREYRFIMRSGKHLTVFHKEDLVHMVRNARLADDYVKARSRTGNDVVIWAQSVDCIELINGETHTSSLVDTTDLDWTHVTEPLRVYVQLFKNGNIIEPATVTKYNAKERLVEAALAGEGRARLYGYDSVFYDYTLKAGFDK